MQIVAFLQNQWFKSTSVERVTKLYEAVDITPEGRADLNARFLFLQCRTGENLKTAFGDKLIDKIVWENASPKFATESRGAFPPDLRHIKNVLDHFKPEIVITFGVPAHIGVEQAMMGRARFAHIQVIRSPHPTARHPTAMKELREAAAKLRKLLA